MTNEHLIDQQRARIAELEAIVDRLPKCWRLNEHGELVRDVPVTPGMPLWQIEGGKALRFATMKFTGDSDQEHATKLSSDQFEDFANTPEAAAAARDKGKP